MNKFIIGLLAVAALGIGWFILNPGETFDYVVAIDSEITELENELAELNTQVQAGTMSEEAATVAKVRIVTRLNAINTAATNSEKAQLSAAQRAQLSAGLDRLKNILVTYQNTLAIVEVNADEATVEAEVKRRGGLYNPNRTLNQTIAATIDDVEETVVDSVPDYEPDTALDAQVDLAEDTTAEAGLDVEAEGEMEDEATEDGDTSDEDMSDQTMEDSSDETMEDGETMDDDSMMDVEVSADAELETTTTN